MRGGRRSSSARVLVRRRARRVRWAAGLVGAAAHLSLSIPLVTQVSGKPIKFMGVGEKMDSLEQFFPERMAGRILGMGDMLTLYEKVWGV